MSSFNLKYYHQMNISAMKSNFYSSYSPHQIWSLPDSIIYYITTYPSSSKAYQKLIQSCKYFFIKNPIIVAEKLNYSRNCKWQTFLTKDWQLIDFTHFSKTKFWIIERLGMSSDALHINPNAVSAIIPHFYRIDITNLNLRNQIIYLNEFLFLSSNVELLTLKKVTVKNQNSVTVTLSELVKVLPKVKIIQFYDNPEETSITSNIFKKFLEIPHFSNIKYFYLFEIPELFDIENFYAHMKKNINTKFSLSFVQPLSEDYSNKLELIVDEILAAKDHDYKVPFICGTGISFEKLLKLNKLFF